MSDNIVISQYSITDIVRASLTKKLGGSVTFLVVSHFAHTGYVNLFRQLRAIHCENLFVFTASNENQITLPVLRLLVCLTSTRKKYVIDDEGRAIPWNWMNAAFDALRMGWSLITGLLSLVVSVVYLKFVSKKGLISTQIRAAFRFKHILYLRPALWQGLKAGGAISHSRGVIRGFIEMGYSIDCVADSQFIELPADVGRFWNVCPDKAYILPRELNYFNFQSKFVNWTRKKIGAQFHGIIYQRLAVGSIAGVILSRLWHAPLIIEYNGSEVWLANNWGSPFFFEKIVRLVENEILSHAHLIVTVSEPLKRDLISKGVDPSRITVCPNGVDLKHFNVDILSLDAQMAERKKLGFAVDDIIFTFVGTFGAWHGATLLADAIIAVLGDVKNKHGKIRFLLVGNGVEFDEVAQRLKTLIDDGFVVMTGLVEQDTVPALLNITDVCLSPTVSNQDGTEFFGSPTKLFEYMAAGKPVIASAIGQINEIMSGSPTVSNEIGKPDLKLSKLNEDQAIGVLVETRSPIALKSAILLLADQEPVRRLLSQNARVRAEERYSWHAHVQKMLTSLQNIEASMPRQSVRVLINALHSKSGGGVTYIRNMLPELVQHSELDIHIVLQDKQVPLFEDYLKGVSLHTLVDLNGFGAMIFAEQMSLPKIAKEIDASVIFSTANYGPLIPRNTVILLRNSLQVVSVERRLKKLVYWFALTAATLASFFRAREVIAVSIYARNTSISGVFKRLREGISIVPHGISDEFRAVENTDCAENFILTVSDIYVQKNLQVLIRGFADVLKDRPGLILKVAGKPLDQEYYSRMITLIDELNITNSVQFLGHVENNRLKELYKNCSVFAFPSTVETFGNPLVEAMACGCPIVCSNAAAMPEIAGDAVIYVDPLSPSDISKAIVRFLDDGVLRAEFRKRAKKKSIIYSWAESSRKTAEVLVRAAVHSKT